MKPLSFDELKPIGGEPELPRLPFFDRSNQQVFRCGSVLHARYSDHRAWCERQKKPHSNCHCKGGALSLISTSAEPDQMSFPKPRDGASRPIGGAKSSVRAVKRDDSGSSVTLRQRRVGG